MHLALTIDKPMAEVARDLGINDKTLGAWVRKEREQKTLDALPGAFSEHERLELKRLRKEVADLKVEREILRKAAAYLAKEDPVSRFRFVSEHH